MRIVNVVSYNQVTLAVPGVLSGGLTEKVDILAVVSGELPSQRGRRQFNFNSRLGVERINSHKSPTTAFYHSENDTCIVHAPDAAKQTVRGG
jgi:hypothetical protein